MANTLALAGWAMLVLALWRPRGLMLTGGFLLPALLGCLSAGLVLA